ncbi:MAG TPA: hypothetical protein VHD81_08420 [Mycobacteriales bacterium]|nr:hypothetical protein [Mycobacteriales bacterium]
MAPLRRRISLIITSALAIGVGVAVVPLNSSYAGVAAPAPTLVSPANETDTAVKDVILDWKPVAGASSYEVQVSRNAAFTNNGIDLPNGGVTTATLFEMPLGLPHTTYFWRVRAKVSNGIGAWSQPWQFLREWEAPISIIQTPNGTDPTLSWGPVRGASVYHVIFDTSPVTADDLLNTTNGCFTGNTSFTPGTGGTSVTTGSSSIQCDDPTLVDGATFYWGIAAFDSTNDSPLDLNNGATGCGTQLPECDANVVIGPSFKYLAPPSGTGTQLTGLKTSWHSNSTSNVCDATTPCPMTPTFSWNPVPGADVYVTDIYLDRDATSIYRELVSQTARITPPDQFQDAQPGRPYYWTVDAATCGGPGVQCSAPAAAAQNCPVPVTTSSSNTEARPAAATPSPSPSPTATPTPPPTITAVKVSPPGPEGDQSMRGGTSGTVTITGTGITNGACVIASAGVVTSVPAVGTNSVTFGYYAPVPGGSVTFKVENADGQTSGPSTAISVDSSAHSLALSATSSFQKQSGPIGLTSPADGAVVNGSNLTFKWDDYIASGSQGSYDVKNYELQVAKDKTFSTLLLDKPNIDLTQYTSPTGFTGSGHIYWRVNAIDESGNQLTWSATREVTLNATQPTVSFATADGARVAKPLTIQFSELVKGVNRGTLKVVPENEPISHAIAGTLHIGAAPTQFVFTPKHPLATGGSYALWVSPNVVDVNGNRVLVSGASLHMNQQGHNTSKGWHFSHGWTRNHSSGSFSGSDMEARAGRTASIRIEGDNVQVAGCKGPGFGSISFSVAGIRHTVNEHQSFTRCGVYIWHTALPAGIHTLRVRVVSRTGSLDGLAVN